MRDLIIFMMVLGGLPFALTRPFFGLLMFNWLAYMRPQDLCWGPARGQRFSLFVALCMFIGFFVYESRPFTRHSPALKWILLLALWVGLSLPVNGHYFTGYQIGKLVDFYKVIAITLLTIGLTDSKRRLDLMIWTVTLSLGFYGIKGGIYGLMTGGRIMQGPGGMLKDNNDLCLAMNMILPLFFYMGQAQKNIKIRRATQVAVVLTIITIIITTSRGGMLTLAGMMLLMVLKSRKKLLGLSIGAFSLAVILLFLPQDVKDRLATLKEPTKEGSAAGRLFAWGVAWNMFKANPTFGVGFESFVPNFAKYTTSFQARSIKAVTSIRVTHNSYLQLLSETGGPSLVFFLIMNFTVIFMQRKIRRMSRARDGPSWIFYYSHMVEVSLAGFMAGAMFLNRSHFDLLYTVIAFGTVVYLLGLRALAGEKVDDDEVVEDEHPTLVFVPPRPNLAGGFR